MDTFQRENIELRADLRVAKEQLAQAHQSTQYLLQLQAHASHSHKDNSRFRQLEAENAFLTRRLALLENGHGAHSPYRSIEPASHQKQFTLTQNHNVYPSTNGDISDFSHQHQHQDDLLSFDDTVLSPTETGSPSPTNSFDTIGPSPNSTFRSAWNTPSTPFTPGASFDRREDASVSKPARKPIGLRISNITTQPQSIVHPPQQSHEHSGITASSITPPQEIEPQPTSTDDQGWQAIIAPPPPQREFVFDRPFADYEHKKLSGMATFIEDMAEAQLESYWKTCASKESRHSTEEWRMYYEEYVRPRYLAKARAMGATGGGNNDRRDGETASGDEESRVPGPSLEKAKPASDSEGIDASQWVTKTRPGDLVAPREERGIAKWHEFAVAKVLEATAHTATTTIRAADAHASAVENEKSTDLSGNADSTGEGVDAVKIRRYPIEPQCPQTPRPAPELLSTSPQPPPKPAKPAPPVPVCLADDDARARGVNYHPHLARMARPTSRQAGPKNEAGSEDRFELYRTTTPELNPDFMALSVPPPAAASTTPSPRPFITNENRRNRRPFNPTPTGRPRRTYPESPADLLSKWGRSDPAICNTVVITNIPISISLTDALAKVRGGKIASATFLPTAGMKTVPAIATNSAMVSLFGSGRAAAFAAYCSKYPIKFAVEDGDESVTAKVELIKTPSRSIDAELVGLIVNVGLTRILFILDPDRKWSPDVVMKELQRCNQEIRGPIAAGRDEDGILFFEFGHVEDANKAWCVVNRDVGFFGHVSKGFLADPGDRPLKAGKDDREETKGEEERGEEEVGRIEEEEEFGETYGTVERVTLSETENGEVDAGELVAAVPSSRPIVSATAVGRNTELKDEGGLE